MQREAILGAMLPALPKQQLHLLDIGSENPSSMAVQENFFHRVSDDPPRTLVCREVALPPPSTSLLLFLSGSMLSMLIDGYSEHSLTAGHIHIARHRIGNVLTKGLYRRPLAESMQVKEGPI